MAPSRTYETVVAFRLVGKMVSSMLDHEMCVCVFVCVCVELDEAPWERKYAALLDDYYTLKLVCPC